jgi:hypothetical protein
MIMSAVDQRKGDAGAFPNRVANFVGQNKIRTNQIERQDCDSLAPVIQYQGARKQFIMHAGTALDGSQRRRTRERCNHSLCRTGRK